MNSKEARNNILIILGILALLLLAVAAIMQFGNTGFGIVGTKTAKSYDKAPDKVITDGKDYQAIIKTNFGDIKYDLLEKNAPTTVNNFVFLSRDGYYNQTKIHRVEPGFVIQGGSILSLDNNPANDGFGNPGYRFANEINWDSIGLSQDVRNSLTEQGFSLDTSVTSVAHEKYDISMANAGPNSNGSQFFIVLGNKEEESIQSLNGKHTVFARIISGQDVVDRISGLSRSEADPNFPQPAEEVVINAIEILEL